MTIPVIDLTEPEESLVTSIDEACRQIGFFVVTGHGIDPGIIDNGWREMVSFFSLPQEDKLKARHPDPDHPYGFFPPGKEALAASLGIETPPDLKESFNLAPPLDHKDEAGRFGGVERVWPPDSPLLAEAWTAYYDSMVDLSERLLSLFARAFGVPESYFMSTVDQHLSAMRGLCYPPLSEAPSPGQMRAGEHCDYGTLTILLPGLGSGGLQVQTASGEWANVDPIDGGFVVNLGDMMQLWSNDQWKSTRHRVAVPSGPEAETETRYSIAFFHQPNWNAAISTIPTCVDAEHPARYETVRAGPWLMDKFESASQYSAPARTEVADRRSH